MSDGSEQDWLSAECSVARQPGYTSLHLECRQTADIPLPSGGGILLVRRCPCTCHVIAPNRKPPAPRYLRPVKPLTEA